MNTTPQISPKDGHWYWVVYTPASGKAFDPAPACYRLEFDTWHSNLFSGVFSDLVTVLDEVIAPSATGEDPNALAHVWPCANIDLDEHGNITNGKMYAPGFPAGNHDVYPVRVPYMDEHTEAWRACVAELNKVSPGFLLRDGQNGIECAVAAIRDLADRTQSAQADHLPDSGNMIGAQAVAEPHPPTRHCMCADCLPSFDDTEALPTPKAEPAPIPKYQTPHDFKNFHRQLCARFGYVHDEQFWWRDLVSLIEHIASKAQPAAVLVAHRILRRRPDGEWVNDGRYWSDGAPSADLATSIPSLGDGWRIDYAYASPAPAPNALDAETVKKARRYDWLRDFHNGPEGVQDNLPYISAGADNDLVWALIGPDADVGIDAAIAAQSAQGAKP